MSKARVSCHLIIYASNPAVNFKQLDRGLIEKQSLSNTQYLS